VAVRTLREEQGSEVRASVQHAQRRVRRRERHESNGAERRARKRTETPCHSGDRLVGLSGISGERADATKAQALVDPGDHSGSNR
jgi:hypothetical protein